ncbi:hypothetical protein CANCADRAFT_132969 [Tortispora caseinolytica NRRL Y-17796]|uniref:Phosphatidylinositol 3-kinase VPS34 n=1 Tax=Tortispora caseinolytica NRRL Y-17796 TaxID=767744 RepID=A0A1E4TB73_9ASCO|nr:hypothetical protein CANCADRAFT_132969 [Tortispora caseinolytica NRRL Y-17796]
MVTNAVSFYTSNTVDIRFSFKVSSLEGSKPLVPYSSLVDNPELALTQSNVDALSDLTLTAQIWSDSKPISSIMSTSYKSFKYQRKWNEQLSFSTDISSLPYNSQLALTLWEPQGPRKMVPYGGTTVKLFDHKDASLKRGRQKLRLWLGVQADPLSNSTTPGEYLPTSEMDRLEQIIKRLENNEIPAVDWLDNLAFRCIESVNISAGRNSASHFLFIEFPQTDFPIVYSDTEYPAYIPKRYSVPSVNPDSPIVSIHDPEFESVLESNVIERKYHTLIRGPRDRPLDKERVPNPRARDLLNQIVRFSSVQRLSAMEKNLLWEYRYYLTREKKALTKFLKSVSWDNPTEVREVASLLPKWTAIDIDDALELLGPLFPNDTVRSYAVDCLRSVSTEVLSLYLLQLVQALKFEPSSRKSYVSSNVAKSSLVNFLIERASTNESFAVYFYWYLKVESQDSNSSAQIYEPVLEKFTSTLKTTDNGTIILRHFHRHVDIVSALLNISVKLQQSKDSRPKKIERLQAYINDPRKGLLHFEPTSLFLDPSVMVDGIVAEDALVFKSTLSPFRINFRVCNQPGVMYPVLFKNGDDLRQDQLVIQIITLMDRLLRQESLDLKLTPYRILATGSTSGAVQFVPSIAISSAISDYQGIAEYLRHHNPDPNASMGIKEETMDTFIRSCAGYCVITYILGVGDRHLDNLLVAPDGRFFHIDFGYILGRDPKPFPPLMKIPIQVVEAMGGVQSENYKKMCNHCFTAFVTLRKSANLIINLFVLMDKANIPDIQLDPDKAVLKVKEKFCLELSDEEAVVHFQNLINESVSAFFPMVIDRLHNFAQYWRT